MHLETNKVMLQEYFTFEPNWAQVFAGLLICIHKHKTAKKGVGDGEKGKQIELTCIMPPYFHPVSCRSKLESTLQQNIHVVDFQ